VDGRDRGDLAGWGLARADEPGAGAWSWRLWKARDGIAFSLGLYKIAWEGVHLQALEDERISNAQSLVRLLEKTGTMRWETRPAGGRGLLLVGSGAGRGDVSGGYGAGDSARAGLRALAAAGT
jgi:hypothetical protein